MVKHLKGFLQIMNLFHPPSNKRNFGTNFLTNLLWEKNGENWLNGLNFSQVNLVCKANFYFRFNEVLYVYSTSFSTNLMGCQWTAFAKYCEFWRRKKRIIKNNYLVLFFSRIKAFKFIMFLKDPLQKD